MQARSWFAVLAFFCAAASAHAEDFDPTRLIGLDLETAIRTLGLPREMYSYRESSPEEDDVVFYYPDSLYLFWFQNRVWQVRCDRRFAATVLGVTMGMPRDQLRWMGMQPLFEKGDSVYFDLNGASFPLRMRLVFADSRLTDLYVYRSDY
jgi:hypothetical protein